MARKHLLASSCFGLALVLTPTLHAQQAIGDVSATDAKVQGSVLLVSSGTRVMSGSSVTAGPTTASLRLARGGEVRICPHANVSLANSQSGRDLVIGMSAGTIEAHYNLGSAADTIMTPDFRVLLAGPGKFHLAIGADARGNTCVRSLPGDTASVVITEIMGDGVYQVLPGEEAYFHGGSINRVEHKAPPDCGCPAPATVMMANANAPIAPNAANNAATNVPSAPNGNASTPAPKTAEPMQLPANSPEAMIAQHGTPGAQQEMVVPSPNGEIHVQVDAPFIYRATQPADVPPPPTVATLSLAYMPKLLLPPVQAQPPAQAAPSQPAQRAQTARVAKPHKGVFGHVRSFFAAIFK